jgi:rubredoxin
MVTMTKYLCNLCDYVYDPEVGDLDSGIPAGTPFDDLPDDWYCPLCGVGKEDFSPVEIL